MAMDVGATMAADSIKKKFALICLGELGIGNTTSASALFSAFCNLPAEITAGRGTGISEEQLAKKVNVIDSAVKFHQAEISSGDPERILAAVGGFEIAALVGAILEACKCRCLVVVDGFAVTVACLVALRLEPNLAQECLIFSHSSPERGHAKLLEILQIYPILSLGMRLGEGTGACLAVPLIRSAAALYNNMATFASAGVSSSL